MRPVLAVLCCALCLTIIEAKRHELEANKVLRLKGRLTENARNIYRAKISSRVQRSDDRLFSDFESTTLIQTGKVESEVFKFPRPKNDEDLIRIGDKMEERAGRKDTPKEGRVGGKIPKKGKFSGKNTLLNGKSKVRKFWKFFSRGEPTDSEDFSKSENNPPIALPQSSKMLFPRIERGNYFNDGWHSNTNIRSAPRSSSFNYRKNNGSNLQTLLVKTENESRSGLKLSSYSGSVGIRNKTPTSEVADIVAKKRRLKNKAVVIKTPDSNNGSEGEAIAELNIEATPKSDLAHKHGDISSKHFSVDDNTQMQKPPYIWAPIPSQSLGKYGYQCNSYIPNCPAGGINISILMPYPTIHQSASERETTTVCKKRKERKKKMRKTADSSNPEFIDQPSDFGTHLVSRARMKISYLNPKLENGLDYRETSIPEFGIAESETKGERSSSKTDEKLPAVSNGDTFFPNPENVQNRNTSSTICHQASPRANYDNNTGINDQSAELREKVLDEDLKVDKSHVSGFGGFRVRNSKREALNDEGNDYSADYQGYFRLSSGKSPTSYIMLAFSRGRTNQADDYADKDFPNADGAWKFKQQLSR